MVSKNQLTGMQGVYLVAAELSRHGLIASPTSRSARGAYILVTDPKCRKAFSVQVKTKSAKSDYWLLNEHTKEMVSDSHIYVLVRIKEAGAEIEFFIIPSQVVADKMFVEEYGKGTWYSFTLDDAMPFKDKWDIFLKTG